MVLNLAKNLVRRREKKKKKNLSSLLTLHIGVGLCYLKKQNKSNNENASLLLCSWLFG
jgi:hypothetical protein